MKKHILLTTLLLSSITLNAMTFAESTKTFEQTKKEYKDKLVKINKSLNEKNKCINKAKVIEDLDRCGLESLIMISEEDETMFSEKTLKEIGGAIGEKLSEMKSLQDELLEEFDKQKKLTDEQYNH